MRHPIIDEILTEWAYRVHDGMPNPQNPMHIVHLKESLQHLKIDEEVINIMINSLLKEADETNKKLTKQGVLDILKKHKDLEQQGVTKTKIYGDVESTDFIKILKTNFKGVTDIKWYESGSGPNTSGRDRLFQWKYDGHEYQIHLAKVSVTG